MAYAVNGEAQNNVHGLDREEVMRALGPTLKSIEDIKSIFIESELVMNKTA